MVGKRRDSLVLPVPGRPMSITLCPSAAESSSEVEKSTQAMLLQIHRQMLENKLSQRIAA